MQTDSRGLEGRRRSVVAVPDLPHCPDDVVTVVTVSMAGTISVAWSSTVVARWTWDITIGVAGGTFPSGDGHNLPLPRLQHAARRPGQRGCQRRVDHTIHATGAPADCGLGLCRGRGHGGSGRLPRWPHRGAHATPPPLSKCQTGTGQKPSVLCSSWTSGPRPAILWWDTARRSQVVMHADSRGESECLKTLADPARHWIEGTLVKTDSQTSWKVHEASPTLARWAGGAPTTIT